MGRNKERGERERREIRRGERGRGELSTAVICLFDLNATAESRRGQRRSGGGGDVCRDAAKGRSTSRQAMAVVRSAGNAPKEGTSLLPPEWPSVKMRREILR